MDSKPGASERYAWFLLAGLGVFIIVLIASLANYKPFPSAYLFSPTTLPGTASLNETTGPTSTSTLTPRATWTLRPQDTPTTTLTPTITPESTRVLLPTLTAALPYKFNFRYNLSTPAPETADLITGLMRQLPDVLYTKPDERQSSAYHQAYRYAVFAYQEALLRYPQAPQSSDWRWGLAYSQAQVGDAAAGSSYAKLLLEGWDEKNYSISSLSKWFHSNEKDFELIIHPLGENSGLTLLEIQPGEMYLLMKEADGKVKITPFFDTFIFSTDVPSAYYYGDLTGDGSAELAFYRQSTQDTRLQDPIIFDLSGLTINRLPIEETIPLDTQMGFNVGMDCPDCISGSQAGHLQLSASIFPACPIVAKRSYRWDGGIFRSQPLEYTAQPVAETLAYCETILANAAKFLPASANVALLQALQPLWPPPLDLGGRLYPEDSKASLAYHLGIYQALSGDAAGATKTLQELAGQDVKTWSTAADLFLEKYEGGSGLLRACQSVPDCSPGRALQQVLIANQPKDLDPALRLLWDSGLSTAADGVFDFNQDGRDERWFTMRSHSGEALEFWIMTITANGVQAIPVEFVEESKPSIYFSVAYPSDTVFQLEPKHGYALRLTKERQEPYIEEFIIKPALTTYTRDQLEIAENRLFSGTKADIIAQQLEGVLSSGHFNCLNDRICDRFYYVLGLSYELSGRDRDAIDTYIKLWWENKNSPFTTMARSKLIFNPPITPGPSPTPTMTVTRTPRAGPSPTFGPSPTEDTYPNPEITQETPTPYP